MENSNTQAMTMEMARKILISVRDTKRGYPQDLRFCPSGEEIAQAIETVLHIER